MGNMYNILFGENMDSDELLDLLGVNRDFFGRYRYIFLSELDNEKVIVVYTRLGNGNWNYFSEYTEAIENHPNYIKYINDDFDKTYCKIYFSIPAKGS